MKNKEMLVRVKNVTEGEEKYVVARLVSGELWYYGRYPKEKANQVASEFENGIVLIDETAKEPKPVIKHTCGRELTDFDLFMNFCPLCMKPLKEKE